MNDIDAKVSFLVHYIEMAAGASIALQDDHAARVLGRALFLGLDSFLRFAPALKNAGREAGTLSADDAEAVKERIAKLRTDYEGYYATLRDKAGAHQQEVALDRLIELWNDIDTSTLAVLADDVKAIFAALHEPGLSSFPRPKELDVPAFFKGSGSAPRCRVPEIGIDRVGSTRPRTMTMVAMHPTQEKCQRIVTAFDNLHVLTSDPMALLQGSPVGTKIVLDLMVVDLCSILDNLYVDRAADAHSAADPCLVTLWRADAFKGTPALEIFARDRGFETQLRDVRNKASGHIDSNLSLSDIFALLKQFPRDRLATYPQDLWGAFSAGCMADIRSKIFLVQRAALAGVVSVVDTGSVKPFSS